MYSGPTYTFYEDVYYSTNDLDGYFVGKQTTPTPRPTLRIETVEYSNSNVMPSGRYAQQHDDCSNLTPRGRSAQQHGDWYGINKQQPHWSITSTEYYMHDPNRHVSPYKQTKDANQLTGDKFSNGISNNEDDSEDDTKDETLYTSIHDVTFTEVPAMIPMRRKDTGGGRAATKHPNPRATSNYQSRFGRW